MTQREAFEAWAKNQSLDTDHKEKDAWGREQYSPHIHSMWQGWQAAQAQTPDCGCIGPRDCTGECFTNGIVCGRCGCPDKVDAAVEPFAWVTKIGILLPPYEPMSDDVPLYTSPPDHTKAMRLALEALNNSVDLVWEEYTEAERNYGNYPSRKAKLDGMKAMAQKHDAAIIALEKEIGE